MNENNEHIEDEELKKTAPHLFGMEKKNDFQVPDGYFDRLPSEIQDKIIELENNSLKSKIMQIFNWKIAVPAVSLIAILFVGIYYTNSNSESKTGGKVAIEQIDTLGPKGILEQEELENLYAAEIEEMSQISEEEYVADIMESDNSIIDEEVIAFDFETEDSELDELFASIEIEETGDDPENIEETFSSSEIGDYFFDNDLGLGDLVGEL
jgi:hypothetical protein